MTDVVKSIIKSNHIFNNIVVASKPYIIKVSPKSDIAIIWLDIWDVQSNSNARGLINRCLNVGSHITTIQCVNMNLGVPQCKNYWKWDHTTFSCRAQESKCVKCNGSHKTEHYQQFAWCCKTNFKINLLRLKTKQNEPCFYTFKCLNYKDDYQADSNLCPFWKHQFNRKWYSKKYQKLQDIRR